MPLRDSMCSANPHSLSSVFPSAAPGNRVRLTSDQESVSFKKTVISRIVSCSITGASLRKGSGIR